MRGLIALKAFGLDELSAVRYYTAMIMAEHGVISAPNMAVGEPFQIGTALPNFQVPFSGRSGALSSPAPQPGTEKDGNE
jgi:hypothetical protein